MHQRSCHHKYLAGKQFWLSASTRIASLFGWRFIFEFDTYFGKVLERLLTIFAVEKVVDALGNDGSDFIDAR